MIHAGAVAGAAVSQGKSAAFGFDTSWTKFQDLRNDKSKRDFVTFGAAAGVAAAFSAPIGGVLFTLEEGASYWSTNLTFRAFFCAMITQLTLNLLYSGFQLGRDHADGLFAFGFFNDFSGYATFELFIFILMGAGGGVMGAFFNDMNRRAVLFRRERISTMPRRAVELFCITILFAMVTFIVPLMWDTCTAIPTDTADWDDQEVNLLDQLVQYQCADNQYNQVASLYFVPADVALQQLFHFKESDGTTYTTFTTGALLMFFIPYFAFAILVSGLLVPAGLFVPMLLSGASYGRIVGHILNTAFPGYVTDSGTYALIGAAALLGGMSRMTMAGTIIMLEASGKSEFLLPLMLTFAAARYSGNAINHPIYDMLIELKSLPFLESSLKTLGLLNYHPVVEIMSQPVVTLCEINKVGDVHRILSTMSHNGFPVVGKTGHLKGLVLRKHLCTLMKLKAYSAPVPGGAGGALNLAPAATVFHDTLERTYPNYPRIEDIVLTPAEMVRLLLCVMCGFLFVVMCQWQRSFALF
jgi:chloride channel 7